MTRREKNPKPLKEYEVFTDYSSKIVKFHKVRKVELATAWLKDELNNIRIKRFLAKEKISQSDMEKAIDKAFLNMKEEK